uniref:Raf homolog serine/threonine-protein kinase n=1 Tax=Trichuris muris TaxID=70415 RepID=A0A5S6R0I2_TRIMR
MSHRRSPVRVAEFFSGIGGMHAALKASGIAFQIVASYEIDESCCKVYDLNFGEGIVSRRNIEAIRSDELDRARASVWVMSPPCQPFTRQKEHGPREVGDMRVLPFQSLLDKMLEMQNPPTFVLLENIPEFALSEVCSQLKRVLIHLNFVFKIYLLDSQKFGIPNRRNRLYLIAKRCNTMPASMEFYDACPCDSAFPEVVPKVLSEYVDAAASDFAESCAIPDGRLLRYVYCTEVVDGNSTRSCCFTKGYGRYIKGTGPILKCSSDIKLEEALERLDRCDTEGEKLKVAKELKIRLFHPEEIKRLLGFPDSFRFPDEFTPRKRYQMLGNSINVVVLFHLRWFILELQNAKNVLLCLTVYSAQSSCGRKAAFRVLYLFILPSFSSQGGVQEMSALTAGISQSLSTFGIAELGTVNSEVNEKILEIRSFIKSTQECIRELNDRFAGDRNPKSIFLDEYQQLTEHLHQLQQTEQRLLSLAGDSTDASEPSNYGSEAFEELPALENSNSAFKYDSVFSGASSHQHQHSHVGSLTPVQSPSIYLSARTPSSSSGRTSPSCSPRRPRLLKVHLPFDQHSTVEVKSGVTLREKIGQILSKRNMTYTVSPSVCTVTKGPSVDDEIVSWTTDVGTLEDCEELWVHITIPLFMSIRHRFMRKSFFTLTYCDICMKPIWLQGYRCDWCNVKFHQKCWSKVPTFCEQIGRMRPEELTNVISRLSNGEKILFDPDLTSSERDLVGDVLMEAIHDVVPSSSRIPRRSGGIYVRQPVMPLMSRSESFSHYRSRSTSAPDINEPMKKDEDHLTGEVNRILTAHTLQDGRGCGIDPRLPSVAATYLTAESGPGHRIFLADKRQLYKRESLEGWEIPACEVRFGRKIGSGSFGTVYKGHWFGPVAIKKLNIGEPGPVQLQAFKNEVAVLKKTRHVNILLFMGWVREPHLAIVTQWCEGSSLYKHLHVNEPRTEFSVYQIIDIAKQTAQGMDYLHSKNIIHRDLKSNNIFLTDDWTVKVGDFGLATVKTRWSGSQQSNQPTGSILWMAAEVIRMEVTNPYSHQSDVYSYGIVLFELTSNQLPYSHINNKDQILFMVGRGFLKPDLNRLRPDVPNALRKLIETCIRFQPFERPEMKKILGALESISRSLPKLQRSTSEPQLYRSQFDAGDLLYPALSPKTPAVGQRSSAAFPFANTTGTAANLA